MTSLLYIVPTRERSVHLISTASVAWRLRSGRHEVEFAAVQDEDCGQSNEIRALQRSGVRAVQWSGQRPDALGTKWNKPLDGGEVVPGCMINPDAALLMTDRMIPITPAWDDVVSLCLEKYPNRVLWWRSPADPGTVAPVVPRSWLVAMDWKPAVEAYPYWWIDTHLMELDRLIHGGDSLMMPCLYAGERKATMELRDCAFWCRYYAAQRPVRIAQAKVIADRLGIAWEDRPALLAEFGAADVVREARAAEFEKVFGDTSAPWAGYRRIKAEAERFMFGYSPKDMIEGAA